MIKRLQGEKNIKKKKSLPVIVFLDSFQKNRKYWRLRPTTVNLMQKSQYKKVNADVMTIEPCF